jgi:hypothetical protein
MTEEQVEERGLEPIAKLDRRYRPARRYEAWEVEALGQATVVQVVRDTLDDLLPEPLDVVRARADIQRDELWAHLAGFKPNGSRP